MDHSQQVRVTLPRDLALSLKTEHVDQRRPGKEEFCGQGPTAHSPARVVAVVKGREESICWEAGPGLGSEHTQTSVPAWPFSGCVTSHKDWMSPCLSFLIHEMGTVSTSPGYCRDHVEPLIQSPTHSGHPINVSK